MSLNDGALRMFAIFAKRRDEAYSRRDETYS